MDPTVFNYYLMRIEREIEEFKYMSPEAKEKYLAKQKKEREEKRKNFEGFSFLAHYFIFLNF